MQHIFTTGQFINFIEEVFGFGKVDARHENIQVICPFCKNYKKFEYHKKKLSIKLRNPHIVHCWVCGYRSKNLLDLLFKFHKNNVVDYKNNFLNSEDVSEFEENYNKIITLPEGFELLVKTKDNNYIIAKKYLKSRGINKYSDLWYWKIGVTQKTKEDCNNRIIIPSYDEFGNLNYWTARTWKKDKYIQKYKNPEVERSNIIINENNINWEKELTLVEGVFDLFKCNQNATAVLGSDLNINYKLFQNIIKYKTPILLAFDNEKRAQEKQNKIAKSLFEFDVKIRILKLPKKEMDVGDLCKLQFVKLSEKAEQFSEEYSLKQKISSII